MKPIEIHIEGYKIVISEDEQPEVKKEDQNGNITYVPYKIHPTTPESDNPNITWTGGKTTLTSTTEVANENIG